MAASTVSDRLALAGFLDKWHARWPEWRIAEVFVPASQRETAIAWFALQQELSDAAWAGSDPGPGEAKLFWWADELQGWSQGRRRHPLGFALQRRPAPWSRLAAALPSLLSTRDPVGDREQAAILLQPFATSLAEIGAVLFDVSATTPAAHVAKLLARRLLLQGDQAAPLQIRARMGEASGELAVARAWACELLQHWPVVAPQARPDRLLDALLRARLHRFAAGSRPVQSLPRMTALWTAWRAARN